ncbi:glutamine-hydrolyzing carbamoyl-phosphate synthase small subunit [Micrococcales bacterium 31B]|nr:glutamine-hydrolyzing carbamoyl-phosphate synthase small subunit [Micrococcales bacterium 31B]
MTLASPLNIEPAVLVLENGTLWRGQAYGARGATLAEVVFATAMTGYQETLTDPSYCGQIVVMTAPHIGNTGMNDDDMESHRIWVNGYVVRDPARRASNHRSQRELATDLESNGIVGISGIDTRALTRTLRDKGSMRGGIFSGDALLDENGERRRDSDLLREVQSAPEMKGASFAAQVSTDTVVTVEPEGECRGTVVALDLGIKRNTPRMMAARGLRVQVVPAASTFEDIMALKPDAVFYSNGPGDPAAAEQQVALLRHILDAGVPYFGICFGNQLLGRALGFDTYKLQFGHRGINQPVLDVETQKVEITAQNHGFAVDAPLGEATIAPNQQYGRVLVSHIGLNDNVVEGLRCLDIPAFSVQYHPEAAAGPHDAAYLFDRLVALIAERKSA